MLNFKKLLPFKSFSIQIYRSVPKHSQLVLKKISNRFLYTFIFLTFFSSEPLPALYFESPSPFITAQLMGQLGNQLFIIAATVSLALDHGATPIFPDLIENENYNIPFNYEKLFHPLPVQLTEPISFVYSEPYFSYKPIPYHLNMKLLGYFQSEKYFLNHKREILELFAPSKEVIDHLTLYYGDILKDPKTVSIHVRFYYEDPEGKAHPTCEKEYFEDAMAQFPDDSHFIIFSNQMDRCKTLFSTNSKNLRFIEGEDHFTDLYLMSFCKHNIIANSSYSWWGAYLNQNPGKIVIAPKMWFNPSYLSDTEDLLPKGWIQI